MGPNCAVAEMRAGGAVDDPLPSTCSFTFGYERENVSPHSVIRLFMVSEPMLDRLPDTPLVFWYGGIAGSTFTVDDVLSAGAAAGDSGCRGSAWTAGGGGAWLPPPQAARAAAARERTDAPKKRWFIETSRWQSTPFPR